MDNHLDGSILIRIKNPEGNPVYTELKKPRSMLCGLQGLETSSQGAGLFLTGALVMQVW